MSARGDNGEGRSAERGLRRGGVVVPVLAWAALPAAVLLAAGTTAIALTGEDVAGDWGLAIGLLLLVGVGCLVAARRPRNPVGWLLRATTARTVEPEAVSVWLVPGKAAP